MEPLRLRLKFNDSTILSKSQRLNGLKRSWILVEAQHRIISDVASHILRTFDLSDSCPNGILLSMDGFVLPNFESTKVLKDKDLVCVKRRRFKLLKGVKQCGGKKAAVEQKIAEKLPLVPGVLLLANKEFERESGGCQIGTEEDEDMLQSVYAHEDTMPNGDVSIKKRKASKSPKNTKRKRRRENVDNSARKEQPTNSLQNGDRKKKSSMCNPDQEHKSGDAEKDLSDVNCTNNAVGLDENGEGAGTPSCILDKTEMVSASRSARRKKAKRKWLRSQRVAENEQIMKKDLQEEEINADEVPKDQNLGAQDPLNVLDKDSEPEDDIVPVVVRPGHIRFSAPGKENEVQQYEEAEGSFNWNGIINKKQGQKWGMDKQKQSSFKRNENKSSYRKEKVSRENEDISPQEMQSDSTEIKYTYPEERQSAEQENWAAQPANASMDYEKLVPLTDIPVQGDTIAYRLVELSSSFCPELTSYRVGKVSCFDQESNRVVLVPVPEYPFEFKKVVDDTSDEDLPDTSQYNEDGSLEIDYTSLVDVRIVKRSSIDLIPHTSTLHVANGTPPSDLIHTRSGSGGRAETPMGSKDPSTEAQPRSNNGTGLSTSPALENGKKDVWEEISAALSAKKSELLKEDNWNKKQKSANGAWSYRAIRRSAIGPTMALLRSQNDRQTN